MSYRGVRHRCSCGLSGPDPLSLGLSAGVGLAIGAVGLWMNSVQLSHQADTATTQIVNGLAPLLQANVDAYLKGPGGCADQAAAMGAYLTAVKWLYSPQGCGNGAYGSAGNRCISDRFGPSGPTDQNAKFPWAAYYYWPIANDPRAADCVVDPAAAEAAAIANINAAVSGSSQTVTGGQLQAGGSDVVSSTAASLGIPTWAVLAAAAVLVIAILK